MISIGSDCKFIEAVIYLRRERTRMKTLDSENKILLRVLEKSVSGYPGYKRRQAERYKRINCVIWKISAALIAVSAALIVCVEMIK